MNITGYTNNKNKVDDIFSDFLQNLSKESRDLNKPIYFYRYIGFDDKQQYLSSISKLHSNLLKTDNFYTYFFNEIPFINNNDIIKRLDIAFDFINGNVGNINLKRIFERENFLYLTDDNDLNLYIENCFISVLKKYIENEPNVNLSKIKSFSYKIICWANEYISKIYKTSTKDLNPKVIFFGQIKKHQIYFLILLSLIGCDVLIFDSLGDNEYYYVDKDNKYSVVIENKNKEIIKDNPFYIKEESNKKVSAPISYQSQPSNSNINVILNNPLNSAMNSKCAGIILKDTQDAFKDIKSPLKERVGFMEGESPNIPIFFCRYMGVKKTDEYSIEEYYNNIYLLDKEFSTSGVGYLKFDSSILFPTPGEINKYGNKIDNIFSNIKEIDINIISSKVIEGRVLPTTANDTLNNTIKKAFNEILVLYFDSKENLNRTSIKNFVSKIIIWLNRYFESLFINPREFGKFKYNPKVLFYGDIKNSEIYLLIFLSRIGCDVLYINSRLGQDSDFIKIDKNQSYSTSCINEIDEKLEGFPENEKIIRKATVARNASEVIETILYDENTGLYKPWQFQEYMTTPVTLKTTYEEISILWSEQAKVRPEFKVLNNTVYVPNIFAKVNGTPENINDYFKTISDLSSDPNAYLIKDIPFTRVNYTKEEMFFSAYMLDNKGELIKEEILKCKFYKYSYLKNSLQNFIVEKLDELLKVNDFLIDVDKKFKLKMIMTVLNLDNEILKLIETFDFPHSIPKLILYCNNRNVFSEEDVIAIRFLNLIGFDIVIFTPTNYNNIELVLKNNLFDVHQLPMMQVGLELQLNKNQTTPKSIFSYLKNLYK